MYQVQERVKFYMCELIKDPSGRSLRNMYAEILGSAGRDVRDKESLSFTKMAELLARLFVLPGDIHGGEEWEASVGPVRCDGVSGCWGGAALCIIWAPQRG